MSEEEHTIDLASSPFQMLIAMENEREELYHSFTDIDEIHEIGDKWLGFSVSCNQNLDLIARLSEIVYTRYLDEFQKDNVNIQADRNRYELLIKRISSLLGLLTETSFLMMTYSEIQKNGVFGTKKSNKNEFIINAKEYLFKLQALFFESVPRESLLPISPVLKTIFELNAKKDMLETLKQYYEPEDPKIHKAEGEYSYFLGSYHALILGRTLVKTGSTWWWRDPISQHYAFDKTSKHYNDAINKWSDVADASIRSRIEDINTILIPQAIAESKFSLALHYAKLANDAVDKGFHKASLNYYETVLALLQDSKKHLPEDIPPNVPEAQKALLSDFKKILTERIKFNLLLKGLVKGMVLVTDFLEYYQKKDYDNALKAVTDLKPLAQNLTTIIDRQYLSSLPMILGFISEIGEVILHNPVGYDEVKNRVLTPINQFHQRLWSAVNELVESWDDLRGSNPFESEIKFRELINELKLLKRAASVLPTFVENRELLLARINVLENLSRAYINDIQALNITDENKPLELILKAKVHFYAKRAYTMALQINNPTLIPMHRIKQHYIGSLISGYIVEMAVYILGIQFLTLNLALELIQDFANISANTTRKNLQQQLNFFEKDISSLNDYRTMLSRVRDDCKILLELDDDMKQDAPGIKWELIQHRYYLLDGIQDFLQAIIESFKGMIHANGDNYEDAAIAFDEAKQAAYKASDKLSKAFDLIGNTENEIPSHLFGFGQFNYDNRALAEQHQKPKLIPITELLGLFRQLIFKI